MAYAGHDTGSAEYRAAQRGRAAERPAMRDERCHLHYGKVTSETARALQVTVERRASLSVG